MKEMCMYSESLSNSSEMKHFTKIVTFFGKVWEIFSFKKNKFFGQMQEIFSFEEIISYQSDMRI